MPMSAHHAASVKAHHQIAAAASVKSSPRHMMSPPTSARARKRTQLQPFDWTPSTTPGTFVLKARDTVVVRKISKARHDEVTLEELLVLLTILNADIAISREASFADLKTFLMETFEPACTEEEVEDIWLVIEKDFNGNVPVDELLKELTHGSICKLLNGLFKDEEAKLKEIVNVSADGVVVSRELLVEKVNWRANRDDAFLTLPYAVTYMMVFIALVVTHLRIWERKKVETGLTDWLTGYSKDWGGPYIKEHVNNIPNFWIWLDDTGLPSVFGEDMIRNGQPAVMMASRNYVIGDVKITQKRKNEDEEKVEWFIHSPEAQAILDTSVRGTYLSAAKAKSNHLQSISWADQATEELQLTWCTYNEEVHMFARNLIKVHFDPYGVVSPKVITTAVFLQPYANVGAIISSFLFICCIIYPLVLEGKEILTSLRHGWRGFKEYWGFWNLVDWTAIFVGIASAMIWIMAGVSISAEPIQNLLLDDFVLIPNFMSLDIAQMDEVLDALDVVIRQFFALHLFLAFDVLAIVMKLFKAFQSNSRLSVVTDTLVTAFVDIVHFMIVFMVIFASFALVGHILFGQDLREFISFGASLMTSFHVLMGEFGWYAEFYTDPTGFGSGMPQEFLTIWFLTYMTFVLLVLLNMLLAVILDRYTQQAQLLEGPMKDEAPTLWEQVGRYRKRARETKGFIPMSEIGMNLDSPDVHPGDTVTAPSLQGAFDTMKPEQAAYLMKWLMKEAKKLEKKEDLEDVGAKLAGIEEFVSNMSGDMHLVKMHVTACVKKLNFIEETFMSPHGSPAASPRLTRNRRVSRASSQDPQLENESLFSRVSEQLAQQQVNIQDLTRAVEQLSAAMGTVTQKVEAQEQSILQLQERLRDPQLPLSMQVSNYTRSPAPKVLPNCLSTDTPKFEYSPRTRAAREGWPSRQNPAGRPANVDNWRH